MQGTGGDRKFRWASGNKGKSGGVRVIYYYHNESIPLFLLTVFGKSEKANLSRAERNQFAKFTSILVKNYGEKMSEIFNSIKKGLEEAVAYSEGTRPEAGVHQFSPVDVKNIRAKMGMSQNEFASAFGISVSTLRHWERGDRVPHGPALVLLNVVEKEPQAVLKTLAG